MAKPAFPPKKVVRKKGDKKRSPFAKRSAKAGRDFRGMKNGKKDSGPGPSAIHSAMGTNCY